LDTTNPIADNTVVWNQIKILHIHQEKKKVY